MLNRNKVRITTGLLTGHMAVKCYLNKLNLYQGSLCCRLCDKDPETAEHIIYVIARLWIASDTLYLGKLG